MVCYTFKGDEVIIGQGGEWRTVASFDPKSAMHDGLVQEWLAFLDAITNGTPPAVTGDYARHIMATVFAAEESSKIHQEIAVPPTHYWNQS